MEGLSVCVEGLSVYGRVECVKESGRVECMGVEGLSVWQTCVLCGRVECLCGRVEPCVKGSGRVECMRKGMDVLSGRHVFCVEGSGSVEFWQARVLSGREWKR